MLRSEKCKMQREMELEIEEKERDDVTISRMDFRFKFFIGIFHTILYERGHLPEDAFILTEIFDVDVPICCHIRVFEYIESCAKRVTCLMETKSLDGFVFNLLYDTQVVQRYVFKISEKYNFSEEPSSCGSSLLEMTETARSILLRFKDRLVDVHRHKFCEFARFQIVLGLNPSGIKAMEGGCWSREEWNPFPWSKMMKNKKLYVPPPIKNGFMCTFRPKSVTLDAFPKTNGKPVVKAISGASSSIKNRNDQIQEVYFGDYMPLSISIFVLTYFNIDNLDLLTGNALNASLGSDALNDVEPVETVETADKTNISAAATAKQPSVEKKAKSNLVEPSGSAPGPSHKSVSRASVSTKAVSKAPASVNGKASTQVSASTSSKAVTKVSNVRTKSATKESPSVSHAFGSLSKERAAVSSTTSRSECSSNGNKPLTLTKTHSSPTASASGSGTKRSQSENTNDSKKKVLKTDKRSPSPSPSSSPKKSPARSKYSISFAPAALTTKSKVSLDSSSNGPKITYRAAPFSSPPLLTRKFAKLAP